MALEYRTSQFVGRGLTAAEREPSPIPLLPSRVSTTMMNARFSPALRIREKASQPAVRPYRGQLTHYCGPVDHWRAIG
jgi:hypothetical protein